MPVKLTTKETSTMYATLLAEVCHIVRETERERQREIFSIQCSSCFVLREREWRDKEEHVSLIIVVTSMFKHIIIMCH